MKIQEIDIKDEVENSLEANRNGNKPLKSNGISLFPED